MSLRHFLFLRAALVVPFFFLLASGAEAVPLVFAGGVAGVETLAIATNSTAFRAAGGGLYLHNNGWARLTPDQQRSTLLHFTNAPVGIELGFAPGVHAKSWASRCRTGYLDAGIRPTFIAANAFAENNQPTAAQWHHYSETLREAGVPKSTLILPTFEYANFRPNIATLTNNTVSLNTNFQAIIREAGGLVLDTPSGYFFSREQNYRDWVVDATQWTRRAGGKVVVIVSPHIFGPKYAADVRRHIAYLKEHDALADWYVSENYQPDAGPDYPNVVGHENSENTALGAAWMLLQQLSAPAGGAR